MRFLCTQELRDRRRQPATEIESTHKDALPRAQGLRDRRRQPATDISSSLLRTENLPEL